MNSISITASLSTNNLPTNRRVQSGFTLMELMVVATVIAILASLGFMATTMMREHAKQVLCMSNLRQWGLAISGYAQDNRGIIPRTPANWENQNPNSGQTFWAVLKEQNPLRPQDLNFPAIQPYLGDDRVASTGLPIYWTCLRSYVGDQTALGYPVLWTSYNYAAGVNSWAAGSTSTPEAFMDRRLEANKVLMSDRFMWTNSIWYNNHQNPTDYQLSQMEKHLVINQLLGDGQVQTRRARDFTFSDLVGGADVGICAWAAIGANRLYF